MKLINNTGAPSKIGFLAKADPKNPRAFVYASANDTNLLGVVAEAVPNRKLCEIIGSGRAKVFVSGSCSQGSIIRSRKSADNITHGMAKVAKDTDLPYFKVGVALASLTSSGLVECELNLNQLGGTGTVGYVPYTGATEDVDLGSYGITANDSTIGGATDNVTVDGSGNMAFNGNATVWDDLRILPSNFDRPGVTDPSIQDWQPGGSGTTFKVWCFNQNQMGYFTVQIPHGYKQGSDIYVHTHWTPHARGAVEDTKTVAWKLDYSWANINGTFGASANADMTDTCDGVDHKHLMSPEATITGTDKHISSMLVCRIYRDTTDTWVGTGANGPALLELDFHFELDTVASRTRSAK